MTQSTCAAEPIPYALRQGAAGTAVAEGCRKRGGSAQTCARGKRQVAGMGLAAWRRLRPLDAANRPLTPRVADLTLAQPRLQAGR